MVEHRGPLIGIGREAEVFAWGDGGALKLFLTADQAADAEHEASVTQAVHDAGLPVPAVEGTVEVDGRPGIIFERVDGPSMLSELGRRPWQVRNLAHLLADLHLRVHACELPGLLSLKQMLEEWFRRDELLPASIRDAGQKALRLLPEGDILCHLDFHPDNIVMTSRGPVIIDWMTAKRGDRHADIAATSLLVRHGASVPGTARQWLMRAGRALFHSMYMKRYLDRQAVSPALIAAWRLPLAAVRLTDNIPGERDDLLVVISERMESLR